METERRDNAVMSVKSWVITLLIMCIPVVNIIMLFVWALSEPGTNVNKANWAKATLIIMAIGAILALAFYMFLAMLGIAFLNG